MLTSAHHFQEVSFRRDGRRTKTHVARSLSRCKEESIEVLGLQSGVGGDRQCPRLACKALQSGTAVPSRHAQLEGDALWYMQPVQFVVHHVQGD